MTVHSEIEAARDGDWEGMKTAIMPDAILANMLSCIAMAHGSGRLPMALWKGGKNAVIAHKAEKRFLNDVDVETRVEASDLADNGTPKQMSEFFNKLIADAAVLKDKERTEAMRDVEATYLWMMNAVAERRGADALPKANKGATATENRKMIRGDIGVGEGIADGINERMAQEQATEENRDPIGGGVITKEKIGLHDGKVVYVKGTEGETIGVRVEKRNDGKYELVAEEDGKTKRIAVDDYEGEIYSTAPKANSEVSKSEERGLEDEADSEGGKILDVADAVDKPDTAGVETERAQEEIATDNVGEERGQEPMSTTEGETPESQRVSNPRENPTAEENVHKAVSFAQKVAERLGYRVEVITGDANMNGFISFKDGVIHINKDRIGNRDTTFQHTQSEGWVIGHELYHAIAKALGRESKQLLAFEQACIRMASMTEGFRKYYADMYASYVTDLMRTKGMTIEQAKEAVKNDGFLNEEIAGDFVGKLLESERMQENFFREMENMQDRTVIGEIMHGIKNAAISFKNSLSDIALALKGDEQGVFERQKADVLGGQFAGLIDRIETFGAKKSAEREYLDWAMERSKGDAEATAKFLDLMLGGAEKSLKEWEKKREREVGKAFGMEREEATKFLDALYAERDKIVAKVETIQRAKALLEQERKNKELSAESEVGKHSGLSNELAVTEKPILSGDERDESGRPFVVSSEGTTYFGVIREESGLQAAPIKLSEGVQDEKGRGYGLKHIEAGHGDEIRGAGFASVEEFVSYVAKNYDEDNIRVGKQRRNGNTTYIIQMTDSHENTLYIELSKDGLYWNVNSGGVFRKGYSSKKETVAKTELQQPKNAVLSDSSLPKDGQSGTSSIEPTGEPSVSTGKDNALSQNKQIGGEDGFDVEREDDANGEVRYSLSSYDDGGRDKLRGFVERRVNAGALSAADGRALIAETERIYEICKEYKDKYVPFGNWSEAAVVRGEDGKPVFSVVKANGEYKMNLDFSLVCKKRRTLDAVFEEMIRRGVISDYKLGQVDIARVNDVIRRHGFETACRLCFVDAKRFRVADVADTFCNMWNELVEMDNLGLYNVIKAEGKETVRCKAAKHLLRKPSDRVKLSRDNFMTAAGFDGMKVDRGAIMKLYNSKKGTGGPKASSGDVQYLNEIAGSRWTPQKAYSVGGVRVQSFSDYVPRMVFDYVQMIAELAAKKLPAHSYTKEPIYAKQFGKTGMKINLSLVPRADADGVAPGLDRNGNYAWQEKESFPFEEALKLQNAPGYRENVGTIAVGVSDAHIGKMLDDADIRMVIPYHKSGLNLAVAVHNNIDKFTDYTNVQNTRVETADGYRKLTDAEAKGEPNFNDECRRLGDPRAAAKKYVDWCRKNGYAPKFDKWADHPNYYKLLEDFTLLVPTESGETYCPMREVRAEYPAEGDAFGGISELIKAGLEEDAVLEGRRTEKIGKIVDDVERELGGAEEVRKSLSGNIVDFDAMRERAKAERGIVMPGLRDKSVRVVDVPRHDFVGTGKQALQAAEAWAKENIEGIHTATDSNGIEFNYNISNDAIEKYVSKSATEKSDNIGIHLATLKKLPEIISESIEAEVHPDYMKDENGERTLNNDINGNALIHRFYGAINISGDTYRVKTTIIEEKLDHPNSAHSYEVSKIELLPTIESNSDGALSSHNGRIGTTKLLQGVEKSYDKGVKVLDASEDIRKSLSGDIEKEYPDWLEGTTTADGKHTTQIAGTIKTYSKVGKWILERLGKNASVLDASSGMGFGTRELRRMGLDVKDVEPYQSTTRKETNPATYDDYEKIQKQYDVVLSNAVLNVLPDDWRRDVLHSMARAVKPGGVLFVNTRKAGEERSVKDKIELESPQEILVKRNGRIASYQRFFKPAELRDWVQGELGDGWDVAIATKENSGTSGLAAIVAHRNDDEVRKSLSESEVEELNERFNADLERQIKGELPKGFVYEMGMPSKYLQSTGIPMLPIKLSASIVNIKSNLDRHKYDLNSLQNLVKAIQKPWAIFAYGDSSKAQNLVIGIDENDKQFLVGLSLTPTVKGRVLEINSIRNVFPKDNHEWINWINQGRLLRVDSKEEIQAIIDKLRMNPVAFDYVDLDNAANITRNFVNPPIESDKKSVNEDLSESRKSLSGAWSVDGAHVFELMSEREKRQVLDMVDAKVGSSWTSRFVTNVTNRMRPVNELMQRVVGVDNADDLRKAFGGETPGERRAVWCGICNPMAALR